jgi:hypothetical protein
MERQKRFDMIISFPSNEGAEINMSQPMPLTKIVSEPLDVDARLAGHFRVDRKAVRHIARAALGARNDSIAFDPKTAKGLLAYIYGVRALREVFVGTAGYELISRQNIESVYDAPRLKIMFQTVDVACIVGQSPKAISDIGIAKQAVIEKAERSLFPEIEEEERRRIAALTDYERSEAWYFCVAFGEAGMTCELSRPYGVVDKQFAGFVERIFIITGDDPEGGGLLNLDDDLPPIEFTPVVLKR